MDSREGREFQLELVKARTYATLFGSGFMTMVAVVLSVSIAYSVQGIQGYIALPVVQFVHAACGAFIAVLMAGFLANIAVFSQKMGSLKKKYVGTAC